jgi:putative tricarboxylic transport membrane protein
MWDGILAGLGGACEPVNMLALLVGLLIGLVGGALPGVTSTMTLALFVPFTLYLPPATGLLGLAAMDAASVFGGSMSAILLNIPGTPASIATAWDGHALTRKGQPGVALSMSAVASCFGGVFGGVAMLLLAPPLAEASLRFGPPETFALAVLGLSVVAGLGGASLIKGFAACALGLLIGSVGQDPVTGFPRFTFGQPALLEGFALLPMIIGLFSIPEVLRMIEERSGTGPRVGSAATGWGRLVRWGEIRRSAGTMLRSSTIGLVVGIIPAASPDVAAFVSYGEARRRGLGDTPHGAGNPDGIAAAESANNSCAGGDLIPTLTLGIPGSATAAVFLGAMYIHGLLPGPALFSGQADVIYTVLVSFIAANLLLLPLGLVAAGLAPLVLRARPSLVAATVVALSVVGAFSLHASVHDVYTMVGAGLFGHVLQRLGFPVAPIILALILGPLAEANWDRSVLMGLGSPAIFLRRPIALGLLVLAALSAVYAARSTGGAGARRRVDGAPAERG